MSYKTHYFNCSIIYNWNQMPLKFLSSVIFVRKKSIVFIFLSCHFFWNNASFHSVYSSNKKVQLYLTNDMCDLIPSAHWNSRWCRTNGYTNSLITSFRLHLSLNWAKIRPWSHVATSNVPRVFKIHRFSNHRSINSSSSRLRLLCDTARKTQPQLAHFTLQVDPDRRQFKMQPSLSEV